MARDRIILTEDDFAEEPNNSASSTPASAPVPLADLAAPAGPTLPPVRPTAPITLPPAGGAGWAPVGKAPKAENPLLAPGTSFLIAAGLGVFVAWLATIIFGVNTPSLGQLTSASAADRFSALWTAVIGLFYGVIILTFDRAVVGGWDAVVKRGGIAAVPLFVVSYVAGYGSQAIYGHFYTQIARSQFSQGGDPFSTAGLNDYRYYLLRMLGWAIFGLGIGLTVGAVERSTKRAINGAIGGFLGGAAGGLVFQAAAANLHTSNDVSQLLGIAGVGGLIALATRVVETARRQAWLHVLAGGMKGKEFILYHAITRIGSSPDCEIFLLKDPAVIKLHAQIEDRGPQRMLTALGGGTVAVNGTPISSHVLRSGDQVQIGSTLLAYSERAIAPVPAPGAQGFG